MQRDSGTAAPGDGASGAWAFAVATYGRPGVRAACLALQDRRGADVVAMLALLHRAVQGYPAPSLAALAALLGEVAPWRRAAVLPLRAIRRALKQWRFPGDIAPAPGAEQTRQAAAAAELAAERVELDYLARRLAAAEEGANAGRLSCIDILDLYGRAAGLAFDDATDRADMAILAAAALPDSGPQTIAPGGDQF